MPRYDYACADCGHVFEQQVTHLDASVWCPLCIQSELISVCERLPSAPNFVLKGVGFHKNDYPSK